MMKLTVLLRRQQEHEPNPGTFTARITDGKAKGDNLLSRRIRDKDKAIEAADAAILKLFRLIDPPSIEWQIEDWQEEPKL